MLRYITLNIIRHMLPSEPSRDEVVEMIVKDVNPPGSLRDARIYTSSFSACAAAACSSRQRASSTPGTCAKPRHSSGTGARATDPPVDADASEERRDAAHVDSI